MSLNATPTKAGFATADAKSNRGFAKPSQRRAEVVARAMIKDRTGPHRLSTGIRMIQFYLDRAGENVSPVERSELELAQEILRRQMREPPQPK